MNLFNNTAVEAFYSIASSDSGDCGNIDPQGTADLPYYDNQPSVTVSFAPAQENGAFSVTIPETNTGMAVTVGLYSE